MFEFPIQATKKICDAQGGSLIELGRSPALQVCASHAGETLRFIDAALQQRFDKLLANGSRDLLSSVFSGALAMPAKNALLQVAANKDVQPASRQTPVANGQNEDLGNVKCGPIPDCGLLYDMLSIRWGEYKDRVDELKKEMDDNAAAWRQTRNDLDAQIVSLKSSLDACTRTLSDATSAKNSNQHELEEKQ